MRKVIHTIILACFLLANLQLFSVETLPVLDNNPLPSIGKWMEIQHGGFAHWLGLRYANKELREPINIVIIDSYSASRAEAIKRLMDACKKAGYKEESGHSSGYFGTIDNIAYAQIPDNRRMAFSNHEWYQTNNHGRIFGPAQCKKSWIFTAAFSRESFSLFNRVHHLFVSFSAARNDFCQRMSDNSGYKLTGTIPLENTLNTDSSTTADHDGNANILVLQEPS